MTHAHFAVIVPTFQNILLATDFSPCSGAALPFARALADRFGSTLHLVHVTGAPDMAVEGGVTFADPEPQNQKARERLEHLAQSDVLRGVPCTQTVTRGDVADTITRMAEEARLDLIVLGTHGRHGISHLVLGSVAEQVFRNAACPVLTVGPEVHNQGMAEDRIGAIVYATDFSPASPHAFEYALFLARVHRATLVMVHAVEGNPPLLNYIDDSIAGARRKLGELAPKDPEPAAKVVILAGPAATVILQTAVENHADLIVMGANRRPVANHVPWATAHAVVGHACCPVLTVRR